MVKKTKNKYRKMNKIEIVPNTDTSVTQQSMLKTSIELKIIDCGNILVKLEDQYQKKGN